MSPSNEQEGSLIKCLREISCLSNLTVMEIPKIVYMLKLLQRIINLKQPLKFHSM